MDLLGVATCLAMVHRSAGSPRCPVACTYLRQRHVFGMEVARSSVGFGVMPSLLVRMEPWDSVDRCLLDFVALVVRLVVSSMSVFGA